MYAVFARLRLARFTQSAGAGLSAVPGKRLLRISDYDLRYPCPPPQIGGAPFPATTRSSLTHSWYTKIDAFLGLGTQSTVCHQLLVASPTTICTSSVLRPVARIST